MAIDVRRVAYGEPSVALLGEQVRMAKAGEALAPVSVVVPSNYAAVALRRELARRGGIAAVSFLTLYRLGERLGAPTLSAAGRRPVSAPVVVQAVRAVLDQSPGAFAGVAAHPATELALAAAHRELSGVSEEALGAIAAQSRRAADVVRMAGEVGERLAGRWYDEHDLLVAATDVVLAGHPGEIGPLIVHLPQRLPPGAGPLLQALAARTPVTVNVGATGVQDADRPVESGLRRAGFDVPAPRAFVRPRAARVMSVSDPDEEVRTAVRLVVDAAREGVRLGRVAILFGAPVPYARLLHEHLAAAGIASNGTPVRTIGEMLAGGALRRLLTLPDRRFRRSDVLAVVSCSRLTDGDGRPAPVRAWERVSRAAGVVEGDDWTERLATFVDEQGLRVTSAEADERLGLATHFRRDAERAQALTAFVRDLVADLAAGAAIDSWAAMSEWARHLLARYLGDDRDEWPEAEREAADRVDAALERLAGLDVLGGPAPSVEVFRRTLDGELDVTLQRLGRLGEGVLVGPVSSAVGLCLDRVVVLGLAEGTFPDRRLDDPLLTDPERRAARGELELRGDHVHDDHRHLLAALAAGRTTLCFPRGDLRRPGDRCASRWLLDDATALAGSSTRLETAALASRTGPSLHQVPSFAAGLAALTFPATVQEHTLSALLRGNGPLSGRLSAAIDSDPVLAAGAALAEARRSDSFTRFDGNLSAAGLPALLGGDRATSATRLQSWATCPHAYLLEHVLGVEALDEPERRFEIDALDRGALVHKVLERFVGEGSIDPVRLRAIADDVCDEFAARGRTGRQLFWRRDRERVLADLDQFLADDLAYREATGAEPVATEQRFDTMVALPGAATLRLRGAIDRVDRLPGGALMVLDYKTGRVDGYRDLAEADPHQGGTRLQPVAYALGARQAVMDAPVRFDYWFVTRTGGFARLGYDVTPAVEEEVVRAITAIGQGIDGGLFPLRPVAAPAWNRVDCWFCSPDGLSSADLRRDWERKRADPCLAAYVALCEPQDDRRDNPRDDPRDDDG
ncbi:MAG: PD-(D/E)XK nuclease family protein [Acidimicrobiales bacterium]